MGFDLSGLFQKCTWDPNACHAIDAEGHVDLDDTELKAFQDIKAANLIELKQNDFELTETEQGFLDHDPKATEAMNEKIRKDVNNITAFSNGTIEKDFVREKYADNLSYALDMKVIDRAFAGSTPEEPACVDEVASIAPPIRTNNSGLNR